MPGDAPTPPPLRPRPYNRWREWLIPRTVLGLTALLLAFAIGSSLSGVVLYSYYEYRLTNTNHRINSYIDGFDGRFKTASQTIDNEKQNAQADVQKELAPLRQFQSEGGTAAQLATKVNKSVWFVQTTDQNGAPSVGTAFVVQSNSNQSTLVGSYSTVKASTASPGPDIYMSKGTNKVKATLVNWVENQDIAVFTIPVGNIDELKWVPSNSLPRVGDRAFVASGFGAAGASVTQGFVIDSSQNALQTDAAANASYQGGPVLNSDGQVTGIESLDYSPFGFASGNVPYAIPIRTSCQKLLTCPAGDNSANGTQSQ
jgi:S1-C subfamily serine protease